MKTTRTIQSGSDIVVSSETHFHRCYRRKKAKISVKIQTLCLKNLTYLQIKLKALLYGRY